MVGLEEIQGNHLEIKLEMENTKDGNFGIEVLRMDEQERGLRITINRDRDLIEVGNENGDFTLREDEPLSLRIFVDATLVEVYANERQVVMADLKRPAGSNSRDKVVLFSTNRDLVFDEVVCWKMKSAYQRLQL